MSYIQVLRCDICQTTGAPERMADWKPAVIRIGSIENRGDAERVDFRRYEHTCPQCATALQSAIERLEYERKPAASGK